MSAARLSRLGELKPPIALRCVPVRSTVAAVALRGHRSCQAVVQPADCGVSHMWTGKRLCASTLHSRPPLFPDSAAAANHAESHFVNAPSSAPQDNVSTAKLAEALEMAQESQSRLMQQFVNLPLDRRMLYRDHLLQESMAVLQKDLQDTVLKLRQHADGASANNLKAFTALTRTTLQSMKTAWLSLRKQPHTRPNDAAAKAAYFHEVRTFYSFLLCSGLLATQADLRLVLDEMQGGDLLEPDASFYESVFISLWTLAEAQRVPATGHAITEIDVKADSTGNASASTVPQPSSGLVAGEAKQLHRGVVGDLACSYMGHALAQATSPTLHHVAVRRETWELFFCTFANAQPAPKLMDLWWGRFVEWVDSADAAERSGLEQQPNARDGAALPYQAVHAVLAWCAQLRDMERALKYFNAVNKRGVTLHPSTTPDPSLSPAMARQLANAGSLTAKSTNPSVQRMQLALLVKLMASTKSVKLDGGLRALVVRDVQKQIDAEVLYAAPWGVLNDLLAGLSVPSAMQLMRRCSLPSTSGSSTSEHHSKQKSEKQGKARASPDGIQREIPFYVWASLLRRCCREHLQDQAESLFLFLRHKFRLTTGEKRELVEIMMRMYVTMQPSDFPSALDLFLQHVLRTPPGEPVLQPDGVLYELLIKGADSRNASMMLFLEACASGVALTPELFESLMGSTQFKTVASLSRKLPHDYATSSLDAQLKIPAEADAHLRREEALRARGKPLYDSTGDAG